MEKSNNDNLYSNTSVIYNACESDAAYKNVAVEGKNLHKFNSQVNLLDKLEAENV